MPHPEISFDLPIREHIDSPRIPRTPYPWDFQMRLTCDDEAEIMPRKAAVERSNPSNPRRSLTRIDEGKDIEEDEVEVKCVMKVDSKKANDTHSKEVLQAVKYSEGNSSSPGAEKQYGSTIKDYSHIRKEKRNVDVRDNGNGKEYKVNGTDVWVPGEVIERGQQAASRRVT